MNRRVFIRTLAGGAAAVLGIRPLLRSKPKRTGPGYSKEYKRDFGAMPINWTSHAEEYDSGWQNYIDRPVRSLEDMDDCVAEMTRFLRQTRRQHGIIIQEGPGTPVADMLSDNRRITITGGSLIRPSIEWPEDSA